MSQEAFQGTTAEVGGMSGAERVREVLSTIDAAPRQLDAVQAALRDVDEFSRVSSVRKRLASCPLDTLKNIFEDRGGVGRGKKKKQLLDAIMASYDWSVDGLMAHVLPFGEARVRHVQALVQQGDFECDKELAERDPDAFAANVVSTYPVTFLMDLKGHFVVHLSDEAAKVLGSLTEADWDRYAEMARECARVRAAVPAVVDLYGVVEAKDAVRRSARAVGSTLGEAVLGCLAVPGVMGKADGVRALWHEGTYYLVSGHLSDYLEISGSWYPTDDEKDEHQLKDILKARGKELSEVPAGLVEAGSVAALVASSEEALDLMRLLDDNCPEEIERTSFAPKALIFLTHALHDRDAEVEVEDLVEAILEYDLKVLVYETLRDRVMEAVRRLSAVVCRWRLGGATPFERGLTERIERPAWAAQDDLACGVSDGYEYLGSDDDEDEDEDWAEPDVAGMRSRNNELLDDFWYYQRDKGISNKTASGHVNNTATYLDFLASYMGEPMEEGTEMVDKFLGNYFIRRCMWSTPQNIPTTAASIVRFYECMADLGYVDEHSVKWMKRTIEDEMDDWKRTCAQYNNPSSEMPFTFYDTLL